MDAKDIYYFYKISRPNNLAISFLSFCLAAFLANNHSFVFLTHPIFWAVGIAIVWIAAGGYWINDVYDFKIDKINKPERTVINAFLSVKKVLSVYWFMHILLFLAVVLITKKLTILLIGASILLFLYAAWLKRTSLVGNMLVAFMTALVLMMAGFIYTFNVPLIWAAIFAFEINLVREIVKDIEDIEGDLRFELKTLPIQAGVQTARLIVFIIYILFIISTWLPFILQWIERKDVSYSYLICSFLLVQIPSIFLLRHLSRCKDSKDYAQHSQYVKYLMLAGMITLLAM